MTARYEVSDELMPQFAELMKLAEVTWELAGHEAFRKVTFIRSIDPPHRTKWFEAPGTEEWSGHMQLQFVKHEDGATEITVHSRRDEPALKMDTAWIKEPDGSMRIDSVSLVGCEPDDPHRVKFSPAKPPAEE